MNRLLKAFKECGNTVCTDTRKIKPNCMFFALKGENFNGNKFAKKAIELGAAIAVIDESEFYIEGKTILVKDSLLTLQSLANVFRREFSIPIIGITGSNGKTTAKELIHTVLSKKYKCHSTPGNFNNHIGLPLTLLSMPTDTEICILEMGDNHMGEIETLALISEPSFALITNVGKDHIEGFGSFENNKLAKKELFDYIETTKGVAFVPEFESEVVEMALGLKNKVLFGGNSSKFNLTFTHADPFVHYTNGDNEVKTNLIGEYNIFNLQMAYAFGRYFDVPENEIHNGICNYAPSNLRSVYIEKKTNCIFLDAYNSNPSSLSMALDSFEKQNLKTHRAVIIGDMLELGAESLKEHQVIVNYLTLTNFDVYLVGEEFGNTKRSASIHWFTDRHELMKYINKYTINNTQILLKGSRGIRLEEVLDVL